MSELYPDGGEVTAEDLVGQGRRAAGEPVKVLGNGEVSVALRVSAQGFSTTAQDKIEAAAAAYGRPACTSGDPAV